MYRPKWTACGSSGSSFGRRLEASGSSSSSQLPPQRGGRCWPSGPLRALPALSVRRRWNQSTYSSVPSSTSSIVHQGPRRVISSVLEGPIVDSARACPVHLQLGLQRPDPQPGRLQLLQLRRSETRRLAPIDLLLPPPRVDRLVADLQQPRDLRDRLPAATRSSARRRNSAG